MYVDAEYKDLGYTTLALDEDILRIIYKTHH